MPEHNTSDMIKFAGMGKPAKFGDQFGGIMKDRVNSGVEAIRQKVAAKLGGLDPTGEQGDGAEEGGNKHSTPEDVTMELTADEIKALEADEPEEQTTEQEQEDSNEDTETNN